VAALSEYLPVSPDSSACRQVIAGLTRYVEELYRDNPRFGLIAKHDAADRSRLFTRHILDSLTVAPYLTELIAAEPRRRMYDLGSGAGLPGIPLALVLAARCEPAMSVETVLVERRVKRANFLRGVIPLVVGAFATAGTTREAPLIRVAAVDAERLPETEAHTDEATAVQDSIVVFRAYQQTSETFLASLAQTFAPGTPVCALKGRSEQVELERKIVAASVFAEADSTHVVPLHVPDEYTERAALVWRTATRKGDGA